LGFGTTRKINEIFFTIAFSKG